MDDINFAKKTLDKVIKKARVHFYKPIQIAEILYQDRVNKDINLLDKETYRNISKKWRDIVCIRFLGRVSTSSAKYQDDLFNDEAMPPKALNILGKLNKKTNGGVERYIYQKFSNRFHQMSSALEYSYSHTSENFQLKDFLALFWLEPGLKRSIDKVYEIVVYALFSALVESLGVKINVSLDTSNLGLLKEFEDFTRRVISLDSENTNLELDAKINRVGVTNAADRGLDMWANFGMAIQIKHLSLTEELAENIVSSVSSDRIVIVCKESEEKLILSLLNQIGWRSRIQSIITEADLIKWYEKALRGQYSSLVGNMILENIIGQIEVEFPVTDSTDFERFFTERNYHTALDI